MLSQSAFIPSTSVVSAASVVYPLAVWVPDAVQARSGRAICSATSSSNGLCGGPGSARAPAPEAVEPPDAARAIAGTASSRAAVRIPFRAWVDVTLRSVSEQAPRASPGPVRTLGT